MPPLPSTYKETELSEDINNGVEWVFRDYWTPLKKSKDPLPPRDDVVKFYVKNNAKELDNILKLQGCRSVLQDKVKEVITYYWGFFCEYGFCRSIRVFSFQIDIGNHPPICCKPPRYVPHESEVMWKLVESLE